MSNANKKTKNSFLETGGDGSQEAVVLNFFSKRKMVNQAEKPKICHVERSPLLAKLQSFIPTLMESNNGLEQMSPEQLDKKNVENVEESEEQVISLSLVLADDMQDSPVFKAIQFSQSLQSDKALKTLAGVGQSDDSSSDSDTDDESVIIEAISSKRAG